MRLVALLSLTLAAALASGPLRAQVVLTPGTEAPDLDAVAGRLATAPASAAEALAEPTRPGPLFDPDVRGTQDVWSRVTVRSGSDRDVRWVLPLSVDEATVTVIGGPREVRERTGRSVPLAERSVRVGHPPAVAFDLPAGATRTLVIHVRHDAGGYTNPLPARPVPAEDFFARRARGSVGQGLALGLLFALAAYNLFLFGSFHDRSYLAYVGFLVGAMGFWATQAGLVIDFVWPASRRSYLELNFFALALAAGSYVLFARAFLQTATHARRLDRALRAVTALWAVCALGGVAGLLGAPVWPLVEVGAALTAVATLVGALAAGVSAWRRGYVPALYYLLASSAMIATGLVYISAWFGSVALPVSESVAFEIGMCLEALLLAMALSARIRLLDRQRAEAEAARGQSEATAEVLREAVALKSNLLGFAAHDLRTPLVGILGFADLIRYETEDGSTVRDYGEHIEAAANRLLRLIQDLLVTASLDQEPETGRARPVDLGAFVAAAVGPFTPTCAAKGQRLDLRLAPGCVVRLDEDRFQEVVDNLVSNAVKFSPPGGTLGVEVRGDGRHVWMTVADSGPGFTADDHARLFRPFTRLSARPTADEPSTGLGLSIVKRIVDLHDGRVQVESELGQGARVTVVLDAVRAEADGAPEPSETPYQP